MTRAARPSLRRRGRAWTKTAQTPAAPPYPGREAHQRTIHARLKALVDDEADAAALVQMVRDCREDHLPIPAWVPVALEQLLTDLVTLATVHRGGRWTQWARRWRRRWLDTTIADRLRGSRDAYGLTWAEAADEAAAFFRGTPAAGSPAAMLAAYKRARTRDGRPRTYWEERVADGAGLTARPVAADDWWRRNGDRMGDARGVWTTRPRLAADKE
jgi:hypothetical protein